MTCLYLICRRLFREIVWIVFSKFKDKFIRMLLPSYLDEGILNNNHLFLIDALKSGRILNRPPFERAPLQTLLPPPIEASELGSVCRDTYLFFIGGHKKEGRLSCKPTFLPMGKAGCFLGRDRLTGYASRPNPIMAMECESVFGDPEIFNYWTEMKTFLH